MFFLREGGVRLGLVVEGDGAYPQLVQKAVCYDANALQIHYPCLPLLLRHSPVLFQAKALLFFSVFFQPVPSSVYASLASKSLAIVSP